MPNEKLSVQEFAAKIKTKYPVYESYDDTTLVDAVLQKFPMYKDSVDYSPKKKEATVSTSLDGESQYQPGDFLKYDVPETAYEEEPSLYQKYVEFDRSVSESTAQIPILSQLVGGSNRFVGGIFDLADGIIVESAKMMAPDNPLTIVLKNTPYETPFGELADIFYNNAEYYRNARAQNAGITQEDMDKGFWTNVTEGNVAKGTWLLFDGILENVPGLVVGMGGSAVAWGGRITTGTLTMGTSAAGNKYRQIKDDPRYSPAEKLAFSFAMGAVETLTESLFRSDLDAARSILSKPSSASALRKDFINSARKSDIYKKMLEMGNEEGFEELIVETWDVVTTGIKEGKSLEELNAEIPKIIDAYAMGFGSGGGVNVIANGRAARGSLKNTKAREKAAKTIKDVEEKASTIEDPEQIKTVKQLIKQEQDKLNRLIQEDREYYAQFSEEDRARVVDIDNELQVLEAQLGLISDPELRIERETQALELLEERKAIHEKYPQTPTAPTKATAPSAPEEPYESDEPGVTLGDVVGKRATMKSPAGKEVSGFIEDEGGGKIVLATDDNQVFDLGNIEEVGGQTIEQLGIAVAEEIVEVDGNNITVRGKKYQNNYSNPLAAINRDDEGNILSVTLDAEDGSKRTFKGTAADEIAYNIIMSQYDDQQLESELEELYNADEETRQLLDEIESIKETAAQTTTESTEQAQEPTAEEPAVTEEATEETVAEEPTSEEPTAEEPTTEETVEEEPVDEDFDPVEEDRVYDPKIEPGHFVMLYRAVFGEYNSQGNYVFGPYAGGKRAYSSMGNKEESKIVNSAMKSSKTYQEALAKIKEEAKKLEQPEAKKEAPAVKKEPKKKESKKKELEDLKKFYDTPAGQEVLTLLNEAKNKAGMNFDFKFNSTRGLTTRLSDLYAFGVRISFPNTGKEPNAIGVAEVSVEEAVKNIREFAKKYNLNRSSVEEQVKQYTQYINKLIEEALPEYVDIETTTRSDFYETLREAGLPADIITDFYTGKTNYELALDIAFKDDGKLQNEKKTKAELEAAQEKTEEVEAVEAKTEVLKQEDPQGDPTTFNDLLFNQVAKNYTLAKANAVYNKYLGNLVPKIAKIVKGVKFTNGFMPDTPETTKATRAQSLKSDSKGFVPFINALLSFGFEVHILDDKGSHGIFNTPTSNVDPIFAREGFVYNTNKGKNQLPMAGQEKQEAMSQVSRLLNFYEKGGKLSELLGALNFGPKTMKNGVEVPAKEVIIRGTGVREFAQLVYSLRNSPEKALRKDHYDSGTYTGFTEFANDFRFTDKLRAVVDAKFMSKDDMMDLISKVYDTPKAKVASVVFNDDSLLEQVKENSKEEKEILSKDVSQEDPLSQYTDPEAAKIELDTIEDAESRIVGIDEEIQIEKENIFMIKDELKVDIADIKSDSSLSKEEKRLAIESRTDELNDEIEASKDNIEIYKEDKKAYMSDLKKAKKRLDKLLKPETEVVEPEVVTVKDGDLKMTYKIFEGGKIWQKATAMGENFLLKIKEGMLFNGTAKIENSADIAYLFRHLRKANSENAFAVVYTKEGDYLTAWLGTGEKDVKLNLADIVKFVENAKTKLNRKDVKVTLVHNHPSGKLKPSTYDIDAYNKLFKMYDTERNENALPGVEVKPFVIINLDSGKFSIFKTSEDTGKLLQLDELNELLTSTQEEKEYSVYEIDKDLLHSKYVGARKMYSGKEMAELFSQIKAGQEVASHLGYAILDSEGYMVYSSFVDTDHQMVNYTPGYKALVDDIVSTMFAYNGSQVVFFDTVVPGSEAAVVNSKHKAIRDFTQSKIKAINANASVPMSFNEDVPLISTEDKTAEERLKEGYNPVTKEDVFGTRREAALNNARRFMDKIFWNKVQAKVISAKEVKSSMMAEDAKRVNEMANEMAKLLKPGFVARLRGNKGLDRSFIELASQYFNGTLAQKQDALNKMKSSKSPKAKRFTEIVINMRAYVDARSTRILNDPMYDSLPEESKQTIKDNLGSYVHRSYYFFDHPYFKIGKDAKTKAIAEEHKILRIKEFNSLMGEIMGITEEQAVDLVNRKDGYLKRKARENVLKQIQDWENKRKAYKKTSKSTSSAGLKVDESAMIERRDVPAHIREMLGEIKDPVGMFVSTANALNAIHRGSEMANRLLETLSSTSMYQIYSQEMFNKPWSKLTDTEKSLVTARANENSLIKTEFNIKEREKSTYQKINNPLSPLHGMYIHNDIIDVLEEVPLYTTQFDGLGGMLHQTYLNVLKAQRQTKVLGNIPTWGKNFIGGIFFAAINGVINPTYFLRTSLNLGKKVAKGDKTYDATIKEMAQYGLIGRDVNASTIGMSAMLFNYSMGNDASTYNKYIANNRGKWKNFVRNLGSKYASIDDFTKMIIYGYEKNSFAIKMYGKDYGDLTEQQQKKVQKEAAERVKQNTPTFSRMYRVAKKMLQIPFGDFVGFKAESARSLGMTVKNMVEDFKMGIDKSNKLTKEQRAEYIKDASKKMFGLSVVLGAVPYMILQALMEGDDGEEEKEIRRLAKYIRPGWLNNHSILVKDIDRSLNVTVYDYTGLDPYGTVFSARELGEIVKPNMAVETAYNLMKGQDVYGRQIADPSDPAFQQWYDKAKYFLGSTYIPPNVSSSYRDAKKAQLEDPDVNVFSETFKIMGDRIVVRSYKYNMLQQFRYDIKEYELSFNENYLNTDWGETRKDKLDEIKEKYVALYEVALSRGNYNAIEQATNMIQRSFDDAEELYILYGVDLSE